MIPDYTSMRMASSMGPRLKSFVEKELSEDLKQYNCHLNEYRFDWSESGMEDNIHTYLDGQIINFTGIRLFNEKDEPAARGWMEFILCEDETLIIYWDFLDLCHNGHWESVKKKPGIPPHIFTQLSPMDKEQNQNYLL